MRAYLYLLGVVLIWGFYYFTVEQLLLSGWDPEWMNALRFFIGGGALLLFVCLSGKKRDLLRLQKSHSWKILVVSWVGVALGMWLLTWGQTMVSSSVAGALSAALPLWVIGLSSMAFFGALRIRSLGWLGVFLGTAGIVLIYSPWQNVFPSSLGTAVVLLAMFFIALESTMFSRWFKGEDPLLATTLIVLWAGGAFLLVAIPGGFVAGDWWLLVLLALCSNTFAYLLYLSLILLRSAAFANLYNYLVPPVAIFAGVMIGKDTWSLWLLLGAGLAIFGSFLAAHALQGSSSSEKYDEEELQ